MDQLSNDLYTQIDEVSLSLDKIKKDKTLTEEKKKKAKAILDTTKQALVKII